MCAVCIPEGFARRVLCIPDGSAERAGCVRHSTFGCQPLSIHTLTNFVSVSPLESTLTKTSRKSIKTRDFKSFRIRSYATPLHKPLIKKHLHIHGGRGEGVGPIQIRTRVTNHESPITVLTETRFPQRTSNPIGKRVPRQRGWL
jgi:hypothetical protein